MTVITFSSEATHLRAGDITVQSMGGRSYRIIVRIYTKSLGKGTNVPFSHDNSGILSFGDGVTQNLQESAGTVNTEFNPDGSISVIIDTLTHTYGGPGTFIISYIEANRNEGVLNMDNSVETPFYIETKIVIDPYYGDNNSPVLSVPPIDRGCVGLTWYHDPGAYDPDPSDSLSFELVVPFMDKSTTVVNYRSPASIGGGLTEDKSKPAYFSINAKTGLVTWDCPKIVGEYNIAFIVVEWKKKPGGKYVKQGFVRRDMQIIIADDCKDKRPELKAPKDTCIVAGTKLDVNIIGTDPDAGDQVKIEAFSQIIDSKASPVILIPSPATFTPDPAVFQATPATGHFSWQTVGAHIRERPYTVTFKITDNAPLRLASFQTWSIKVVAPAPKWTSVTLNATKRQAVLKWQQYIYNSEAESMQIWRRIDHADYSTDSCITGMPDLGYVQVGLVNLKDANGAVTTYTDKNLAPGAYYCYRLVVVFPAEQTGGAESYVSEEQCVGPFEIDAPVITKVSVDTTSGVNGKISVAWVVKAGSVADNYKVYRGVGFTGAVGATPVYEGTSLSFVDSQLNTAEDIYHYVVVSYDNSVIVDTSAVASSVRLETQSQVGKISLSWSAVVPWSNDADTSKYHLIFRGPENSKEGDLVLIDSVNVRTHGFAYTDNGPLDDTKFYCYRVMTRGTYGFNPAALISFPTMPAVLKNYSQIICAQPGDSIPPCKPLTPIRVGFQDCETFRKETACNINIYTNTLSWNKPDNDTCRKDVYGYKIYYAAYVGAPFSPRLDNNFKEIIVRDTFFIDTLTTSFKGCYKIAAIDRSNNVSEFSDEICIDNCPQYVLPNVFTPDQDCDNVFSAYGNIPLPGENDPKPCGNPDLGSDKCARFVKHVSFRVYNRWGNEVYSYQGDSMSAQSDNEGNSIYLNWNGNDSQGHELSQGVYYYVAEVEFDVVNPSKSTKFIKGWVQILR